MKNVTLNILKFLASITFFYALVQIMPFAVEKNGFTIAIITCLEMITISCGFIVLGFTINIIPAHIIDSFFEYVFLISLFVFLLSLMYFLLSFTPLVTNVMVAELQATITIYALYMMGGSFISVISTGLLNQLAD